MKPTLIASVLSLLIGFAGGWMMKSTTAELASFTPERPQPVTQRPAPTPLRTSPVRQDPPAQPEAAPDPQLPQPAPSIAAAESVVPETLEKLDQAKWTRLSEILALNPDQAKALEARIGQTLPSLSAAATVEDYAKAGARLETEILAVLTPEQQQAFKELQERDRGSRVEALAQEAYLASLAELDLTPDQRTRSLEILRERAQQQIANLPDSTRLVISGSPLPIGAKTMSDQSLIFLSKLNPSPGGDDSQNRFQDVATIHRQEIAGRMNQFDDILTPAQQARYQLGLQESLENLETIESR